VTEPRSGRPGHPDDDGALPQHVQDAIRAALTRPATLDEDTRAQLYARAAALSLGDPASDIPDDLTVYADKVALWAYKTLDREIDALRDAGRTDDEIFELTICVALGAGSARFLAGLTALDEALAERDTERDGLTDTETADAHTD